MRSKLAGGAAAVLVPPGVAAGVAPGAATPGAVGTAPGTEPGEDVVIITSLLGNRVTVELACYRTE